MAQGNQLLQRKDLLDLLHEPCAARSSSCGDRTEQSKCADTRMLPFADTDKPLPFGAVRRERRGGGASGSEEGERSLKKAGGSAKRKNKSFLQEELQGMTLTFVPFSTSHVRSVISCEPVI